MSKLIEVPDDLVVREPIFDGTKRIGTRNIDLSFMPSIDLVRCRDCVYGFALQSCPGVLYCRVTAEATPPDGFCHNGGRSDAN